MATAAVPAPGVATTKGGFWIRLVAYLIDGIILGVVGALINAILIRSGAGTQGVGLVLSALYFTYLWSANGPWAGQTVGMKVLNLRVIRTDGSSLTLVQSFIRWVGLFISFLVLCIGVIWVAFDANKQGWHDKMAGTYVVRLS